MKIDVSRDSPVVRKEYLRLNYKQKERKEKGGLVFARSPIGISTILNRFFFAQRELPPSVQKVERITK